MGDGPPLDLEAERYISLETYRRDGSPVRTPVWFVARDGRVCVVTRDRTGKAKRLKNNTQVRVAACTIRGKVTGQWFSGEAEILTDGAETADVVRLRDERYGFRARIAKFLSRGKGDLMAISIEIR